MCDSHWQFDQVGVRNRNQHLLETGLNSDCEFLVGQDRMSFKTHKLIISAASPVFEKMFYGEFQQDVIEIDDADPSAFKAMLCYIYMDKTPIQNVAEACDICYLAEKYMIPHLSQLCIDFIQRKVEFSNACRAYEFAKLFDRQELMKSCRQIILVRTLQILKHPSFDDIQKETLLMLLEQDKLSITSELQLYEASMRWANAEIIRKGIEDEAEKQMLYDEILPKIRFMTMKPQDFADGPAMNGYISEADAFAILINICSSKPKKEFPAKYKSINWNRFRSNI